MQIISVWVCECVSVCVCVCVCVCVSVSVCDVASVVSYSVPPYRL